MTARTWSAMEAAWEALKGSPFILPGLMAASVTLAGVSGEQANLGDTAALAAAVFALGLSLQVER